MKKVQKGLILVIIYILVLSGWIVSCIQRPESQVTAALEKDQAVYYLTHEYGDKGLEQSLWLLKDGKRTEQHKQIFEENLFAVTHFVKDANGLVVTGIEQLSKNVYVYFYHINQDEVTVEKKIYDEYAIYVPAKAIYKNEQIAVIDRTGKLYAQDRSITKEDFEKEILEPEALRKIEKKQKFVFVIKFLIITAIYILLCFGWYKLQKKVSKKENDAILFQGKFVVISILVGGVFFVIASQYWLSVTIEKRAELSEVYSTWQAEIYKEGKTTSDKVKTSLENNQIYFQTSIVQRDGNELGYLVVDSSSRMVGKKAEEAFGKKVSDLIKKCNKQGEMESCIVKENDMNAVYTVTPLENSQSEEVLLVKTSTMDCYKELIKFQKILLCVLLFSTLFFNITVATVLRSRSKKEKKERTLVENTKFRELQGYNESTWMNFYQRFIPRKFERVFKKHSLQDVRSGECVSIPAIITCIGFENIPDKERYLMFDGLLKRMYEYCGEEKGILLPENNNANRVEMLYERSEDVFTAVQLGISVLNELFVQRKNGINEIPYVFVHASTVMCGIAGGEKVSVPVVRSKQIEIINTYMKELSNYGVNMVVSEEINSQIKEENIETRYIGYIEQGKSQQKLKLYEVLDACERGERYGKKDTEKLFQKALEQFYANDFYYARNNFLEVLKKCPQDGLSRWYVFACEEMFNLNDYEGIKHNLFFEK